MSVEPLEVLELFVHPTHLTPPRTRAAGRGSKKLPPIHPMAPNPSISAAIGSSGYLQNSSEGSATTARAPRLRELAELQSKAAPRLVGERFSSRSHSVDHPGKALCGPPTLANGHGSFPGPSKLRAFRAVGSRERENGLICELHNYKPI
jgi:hypothetical protein